MANDRIKAMEDTLEWYAEQARLCRLAHSEGDAGRQSLSDDGGKRALAALAASQPAQPVAQLNGRSYRKKPVVIEAVQWTGENLREVNAFTDGPPETESRLAGLMWEHYEDLVRKDGLKIYTLEGKMDASLGDWIIKGVKGEFYPCKPDIFAATYEPASQPLTAQPLTVQDAARWQEVALKIWRIANSTDHEDPEFTDALRAIAEGRT